MELFKKLGLFLLIGVMTLPAASENESAIQELREHFQKDYFRVGFVLQIVGDGQIERSAPGNNGFSIANMRLVVSGDLDNQFGYLLKTNFASSFTLLDAKMYYRLRQGLVLDIGQFKPPFDQEFLTAAESIDLVNRSQVATFLSPGRQIGMQFRGVAGNGKLGYRAGVFNGNHIRENGNDNNDFMLSGRLAYFPFAGQRQGLRDVEIGIFALASHDHDLSLPFGDGLAFRGKRRIWGADVRYTEQKLLMSAEFVRGEFLGRQIHPILGVLAGDARPSGYQLTAGYMLRPDIQLLGRLDGFRADDAQNRMTYFIGGINYWPSEVVEFQANYIIDNDASAFNHHQLLLNAQVAF